MSISETLQQWERFARMSTQLDEARNQLAVLEADYGAAQISFQKQLQDLSEDERQSILAIMSVYQQRDPMVGSPSEAKGSSQDFSLQWLLNKVGNEGVDGIKWPQILTAWEGQFQDSSSDSLYHVLNAHQNLFMMSGERQAATLKLTAEGQAQFLNGA